MKQDWQMKKLGEVIKLEYGKPLVKSMRKPDGLYPMYGANGIKGRTNEYYYNKKTIIVGRKGSAGEINLTEEKFWPLDVTYFVTFEEKEYNLIFLYHLLSSLELPKLAKGVKPGINRNDVYDINTLLPQLPDQKLIVAILDKAFAAIAKAKANAEQNLKNAKELFESYLQEVFEDKGEDWAIFKISDICESIIDCVNKTAPICNEPTPFKMIRTTNIRFGKVDLSSVRFVDEDTYKKWTRRQIPNVGDILFTREAPMGEVGMLLSDEKVFLGQRIVSYRVDNNKVEKDFILYAFQSNDIKDQIRTLASGATVQHLRVPHTKSFEISVPPLKEQKVIVKNLDALSAETKKLEAIYQQKIEDLEELKKSVLQKAFNGELT
jgi:type I restriction enzyme, S subunit